MNDQTTATGPTDNTERPKKRRWLRRIVWNVTGLLVLLLTTVLLLPTLVNTPLGTRWVLSFVNNQIPGTFQVQTISVGWFSSQSVEGLELTDPQGRRVLTVDQIEAPTVSISSLLWYGMDLGTIRVVRLEVEVEQYEDGSNSLAQALGTPSKSQTDHTGQPQSGSSANSSAVDLMDLRGKLVLRDATLTYKAPAMQPVELTDVSGWGNVRNLQDIRAQVDALVRQGSTRGKVTGQLKVVQLFNNQGRMSPGGARIDANVELKELPVVLLDYLFGQSNRLAAVLGPVLNGHIAAKGRLESFTATAWANTQNFKAQLELIGTEDGGISTGPDSSIQLRVQPAAWAALNKNTDPSLTTTLAQPFNIQADLKKLHAKRYGQQLSPLGVTCLVDLKIGDIVLNTPQPRPEQLALRETNGQLLYDGPGKIAEMTLASVAQQGTDSGRIDLSVTAHNPLDKEGRFNRTGLDATVKGRINKLPMKVIDAVAGTGEVLVAAVGPVLEAQIDAEVKPVSVNKPVQGSFTLTAKSQQADAALRGRVTSDGITVESGSHVQLTIDPRVVPIVMGSTGTGALGLAHPTKVRIDIEKMVLPLDAPQGRAVYANLRGTIDEIAIAGDPRLEDVRIKNTEITIPMADLMGPFKLIANTRLAHGNHAAPIHTTLNVKHSATGASAVEVSGEIKNLPVALIDSVAESDGTLERWLGELVGNVAFSVITSNDGKIEASARVASDQLLAEVAGRYDSSNRLITLNEGSWVQYRITPAWLDAWLYTDMPDAARLELESESMLRLTIQQAQAGLWKTSNPNHADSGMIDVRLPVDPKRVKLALDIAGGGGTLRWRETGQAIRFRNFKATLNTTDLAGTIVSTLQVGFDRMGNGDLLPGSAGSRTLITGLFTPEGEINTAGMTLETTTTAQDLPLGVIDAVNGWGGQLVDLLGETLSLSVQGGADPNQPRQFDVSLDSKNSKARASMVLSETITLSKDATANLTLSPQLSQRWLKRVFPLLNEAVSSTRPIQLTIQQKGFDVPLREYAMDKVKADAQLDLGTVQFKQNGLMNLIRQTFKRDTSQAPTARFTPMNIHIDGETVSFKDFSMIMDNLTLGFRGRVNQATRDIEHMTMTVPGQTMAKAFGLGGVIEPGYEFEMPIRGTIDKPELDLGAIAVEAGRLIAKSEIKKHLGGIEGEAAGEILDLFLGGKKKKD